MIPSIELVRTIVFILLCSGACVFAVAGTVGLFRFPDVYTRLQASSLAGTTAVFTVFLAALSISPSIAVGLRVALVQGTGECTPVPDPAPLQRRP